MLHVAKNLKMTLMILWTAPRQIAEERTAKMGQLMGVNRLSRTIGSI